MGLGLKYDPGQTPIDEEEKEGLLISFITFQSELDEFEQYNIEQAIQWVLNNKINYHQVFTESFIRDIHKRMFNLVWKWAGEFRTSNKNIGADKIRIPVQLKILLDDAIYWVDHETYSYDEIAIRFKHRLVSIHCFANGNGRHSRLMADIIIERVFNQPLFSWGEKNLFQKGDVRTAYIKALKAADDGDYSLLLQFARS